MPSARLTTFVPPRPSPLLIRTLVPVNRVLCLGGIPGLRALPGLRRIPGIRGLCDVVAVDLPRADHDRLLLAVNPSTAAFIAPNHPEFFTDWMLDKELSARVAPLMASWATHDVVNGMGRIAQCFWLKNNLIAQIPGAGGEAGRAYSIEWALQGHGVLLHPEGAVGWHADYVAPLFPGIVDMAVRAAAIAAERGVDRAVYIAPVVWKLRFTRDVTRALEHEMTGVEQALRIPRAPGDVATRIRHAYRGLLAREAASLGVASNPLLGYFEAQAQLLAAIAGRLRSSMQDTMEDMPERAADGREDVRNVLRAAERWLRSGQSDDAAGVKRLVKAGRRCLRLTPEMYRSAQWTQEHVAENIKRLRSDWCFGGWRDNLHRFVPVPAGARVAHIRVAQPLDVRELIGGAAPEDALLRSVLVTKLRDTMQSALDGLVGELAPLQQGPVFSNPFERAASPG
jgi:hypothetical protein